MPDVDVPGAAVPAIGDAASAPPRTVYIDPTAAEGGDGSLENPFNAWSVFTLQAGDTALLRGGTVSAGFAITVQGGADQTTTIGSYGGGQAQIQGTIALSGASHVILEDLDIAGGEGHGVLLIDGTTASTVRNCNIHAGVGGVVVSGTSAGSNTITGNNIYENDYVGVWVDGAIASEGQELLVSGNAIYRNAQQGVLLYGSYVIIDGNTVVNNGLSGLPGISAIHAYGTSATDTTTRKNTISNNTIAFQRDGNSTDGNGIMLDHWTSEHVITGNQIFGNDGCGINIFASGGNLVQGNTVFGNMLDAGGTHVVSRAEIYLGEATFAPGLTTGNTISNNTVVSTSQVGAALQVDAPLGTSVVNAIDANVIGNTGGGPLWIWGNASGTTLAGWNAQSWVGDDTITSALPVPTGVLDPAMLVRLFTLHSTALTAGGTTTKTSLVAHGTTKDLVGSPFGSWMAGDGRDNILTAVGGNNVMSAGSGNATLIGGPGQDLLFGGAGNTLMLAGSGNTVMIGGSGNSRMFGGAGDDTIYAGNGTGTKIISGGGGENYLFGGAGVDRFRTAGGLDSVSAFTIGQDTLDVSSFNVTGFADLQIFADANGGAIADSNGVVRVVMIGVNAQALSAADFVFSATAGVTTLSFADLAQTKLEGDTGATSFVFTVTRTGDLSWADTASWSLAGSGPKAADAADFAGGILPSGTLRFDPGAASGTFTVAVSGDTEAEGDEGFSVTLGAPSVVLAVGAGTASATIGDDDGGDIACYATGTRIATPFGACPVENLRAGDPVLTADGMLHHITWAGAWQTDAHDPAHRAVRIRAGALGRGLPERDLVVSPEHGLWLEGMLVPAICLLDGVAVLREPACVRRYHHFALAHHAVVLAEGAEAETFCALDAKYGGHVPQVAAPLPRLEQGERLRQLRARLGLAEPDGGSAVMQGFLERVRPTRDGVIVEGWASDGAAPLALRVLAGAEIFDLPANAWRSDLDRAGLPAAGFSLRLAVAHDTPIQVMRRSDGAILPRLSKEAVLF